MPLAPKRGERMVRSGVSLFALPFALLLWLIAGAAFAESTTLRVGVYHNPPKVVADEAGNPSGIFGDLLREMASREGWMLVPVHCEWQACLEMLAAGELDLMPDVAFTEEREARFDFHDTPVLRSWSQVYAASDIVISSLLDLDGRRVAVLEGSVQQRYLARVASNFGLDLQWYVVRGFEQGFAAVAEGRADAVAANYLYGDAQAIELGLRRSPIMFDPSVLFFAAPAGQRRAELAAIDGFLDRWQAEAGSPFFTILERWGPGEESAAIPVAVWWGLGILGALLLLALLFNQVLRLRVAQKTQELSSSEQRLNTILDSVEAYIYIKDPALRYQYVNRRVSELLGLPREQIIGKTDEELLARPAATELQAHDRQVLQEGKRYAGEEFNIVADDKGDKTFFTVKLPLAHPDGSIYALCGISTDISERRQAEDRLHKLAYFDPLTGLANRRLLLEQLDELLQENAQAGTNGALVVIDLDEFKSVNDTLGHAAGDELLLELAGRLERHLQAADIAARLGADEFVVVLGGLDQAPDQAAARASEFALSVQRDIARPFDLQGGHYVLSASIGIALFSEAGGNAGELLKEGDLALNAAKAAGREGLRLFSAEMEAAVSQRTRLENALREAIHKDELELYLHPQVNNGQGIVGMEALLRWHHPEMGTVPPDEFIPVAERSGLIVPLGEWVLNRACDILADWADKPRLAGLFVSVNISPEQFRFPGFEEMLDAAIERTGVNPERLELEITEGLLINDLVNTIKRMQSLRKRGVHFALDDFGTGYASLAYLKLLPLGKLKIDQSFVRDLLSDPNDEAIIKTIIALGDSLDMQVMAEGVETAAHAERLRELGCLRFQGYHFGRPQPPVYWEDKV